MQCSACGADTPGEAVFCAKCGHHLKDDASDGSTPIPEKKKPRSIAQRFKDAAIPGDAGDEETEVSLWQGGYSAKAMIGGWVIAAITTIVLVVATVFFFAAAIVLIPLIVLVWVYVASVLAYRKMSVYYELTTQRFIHKSGILRRTSDRLEVIDIDDVTYSQGLVERMVNVGSIRISSSDRSHPELVLIGIENVREIADTIDDVRRKERHRRGLHIESV